MNHRVNFREISQRFTHIDAKFVNARFSLGPAEAHLTVRFYPWWEHPLYRRARDTGQPWGFRYEDAARDVTVFALEPIECRLSERLTQVIDWAFCENHPASWRYEDEGEIFCNTDPDVARLVEAILARRLPWVTRSVLCEYLSPPAYKAPFSLGRFPYSLYTVVCEELRAAQVRLHLPRAPQKRDTLVTLVLDDDDYIIAQDFELDVPEFEHRPEWFEPSTGSR